MTGVYAPERPTYTACMDCGADWFVAFPPGVTVIHCPRCGEKSGEPVQLYNDAWFRRFTGVGKPGSAEWKKRALVCLNAKRMKGGE